MKELNFNFEESPHVKIGELDFYSHIEDEKSFLKKVYGIAELLDTVFREGKGAEYKGHNDKYKAIYQMTLILGDAEKEVQDLALLIKKTYKFWS
jgi:hypothetical protein